MFFHRQHLTAAVFLLVFALLMSASCASHPDVPELSVDPAASYAMTVTFLNIGKADCFLIESPSGCVMIDTGTNADAQSILNLLEEKEIRQIDKLFITHFDKDHVGGADKILHSVPVLEVYEPDYESTSKQTAQYRAAIPGEANVYRLSQNVAFSFDGVDYEVDVANGSFFDENGKDNLDNNMSLVIRATAGHISVLFTGDAEKERLYEMLYEDFKPCTLLKVPHHGLQEKYLRQFCDRVKPQFAVITSSDADPEDASAVKDVENAGAKVFLTRQGRVELVTDGTAVSVRQADGLRP